MTTRKGTGQGGPSRRAMLTGTAKAVGVAAVFGLGLHTIVAGQATVKAAQALRPPGALADERDFLAACTRCGLCVRACPYDTLKLAGVADEAPIGTPFFTARDVPCEMCEDIPCVVACPTGALDHGLTDITKADMGVAVLIDRTTCLNMLGLRCDVCYRVCPLIDEAITLDMRPNTRTGVHAIFEPTVHPDACTGCGKCEKACVLPEAAAIKVLPREVALGSSAEHYRLGWEEKRKHGEALIQDTIDLPDRGYSPDHVESTPSGGLKGFKP
ncbi:Ferredoxin-type protein NapG (periplasmic nitrate reductase) [Caenispirillum salinarum AK4]|uniref:Ferredoxin-type protein NapG (Periplasmic nitrate reductase) n=1 Tax=Caenispirillum salinarum AK4 TaxID=1238182 RepID=K9HSL7_9PROT|nr:ferredoxin-type protein NapG [Caenispirillum salinarum]EKV31326.1 Ferredoxin-type protein NapG (periplasmic nitrate reductase) [Caenispirillum salinarum AK4]